jgi:NTP pyrophosphatase (non-canonical NTP hydrolase)
MNSKEYQTEILRTYAGSDNPYEKLLLGALGLAGETGEVVDHIKKVQFAGHALDIEHLTEELGDVLWYAGLICSAVGCTLDDVMQMNVTKLRKRYPNGFDPERSINR